MGTKMLKNEKLVKDIHDEIKVTGSQLKQKMQLIREDLLLELGEKNGNGKEDRHSL